MVNRRIIGSTLRPVILIDWADLDPNKPAVCHGKHRKHVPFYEEVHGLDTKGEIALLFLPAWPVKT